MPRRFSLQTVTNVPQEALFDASLSIDAHLDSMSASRERAIAGVTSGRIGLGESVTWRARHFGVWFTMTSRITELDRPHRFVDEQQRGPFGVFRHVHEFATVDGVTVMTDTVTVGSPVFGKPVESGILVPYLRRLIRTRNTHLIATLGDVRIGAERPAFDAADLALANRLQRWDVIGVYGSEDGRPADDEEYDDLVAPMRAALERGEDPEALSRALVDTLRRDYGLTYTDDLAELSFTRDLHTWWHSR